MIDQKSWDDFKNIGLLWFVNRTLHVFGWSLVYEYNEAGDLQIVYPARVQWRGFTEDVETQGFIKISEYLKENIEELVKESKE